MRTRALFAQGKAVMTRNSNTLSAILKDADRLETEQKQPGSLSLEQWAESEVAMANSVLAARRRSLLSGAVRSIEPIPKVKPFAYLASWSRDALLARAALLTMQPTGRVQIAYRDLQHQSDQDLRLLITLLESGGGGGSSEC